MLELAAKAAGLMGTSVTPSDDTVGPVNKPIEYFDTIYDDDGDAQAVGGEVEA
jgi:hypothetical protein